MRIYIKYCVVLLGIISLGTTTWAQTDGFSLNLGLTLPTKFGTNDESGNPVGWNTGFNVGARFQQRIGTGNLHYFTSVDVRHNGLSSDAKEELNNTKRSLDGAYGYDRDEASSSIKGSTIWHIPLLAGLNYCYPIKESLGLWGEVGSGIVYKMITDLEYKGHYSSSQSGTAGSHHYTNSTSKSTSLVVSYNNAVHWSLHFGFGVSLNKHFGIGINYDRFYGKTTTRSEVTTTIERDYNSDVGHNHTSNTDHPDPTIVTGDAASSAMFTFNIYYSL